jgi:type IX secretion system PorP/SprF family membrane protein
MNLIINPMKNKLVKASIIVIASITIKGASAQDIHFSQMPYSPLNLNPALAGANFDMQAIANYKSQWQSVAVPYKTIGASYDMRLNRKKAKKGFFAAGLNIFNDQAGDVKMTTTNISLTGAYHLLIDANSTIGGALYGGYGQRGINPAAGKWASQYDGLQYNSSLPSGENFNSQNFGHIDAGLGIVYTYKKSERYMTGNDQMQINAGIAAYHLNQPKYSFVDAPTEKLYMRISGFANALIGIGNTRLSAMPGLYYNRQGTSQEILMGSYVKYMTSEASKFTGLKDASAVSAGVFYRNKDAVIIKGMFEWQNYALGIAYDLNTSSLAEVSKRKGGFEIFLRFVSPSPFGGGSRSRI